MASSEKSELRGPRGASADDLPSLLRLGTTVFYSPEAPTETYQRDYPLILEPDNLSNLRMFSDKAEAVAVVGIHVRRATVLGCPLTVGSIGGVCTYEAHRGRGLATALMLDAEAEMRRQGVDLVIVSGGRNLYRRLDYQDGGNIHYYDVPAVPAGRDDVLIRNASEDDAPEMARLYQQKAVRFIRPLEDFRVALRANLRTRLRDARRVSVAIEWGQMVAYLGATVRQQDAGSTAEMRAPNELAGDPAAILALAGRMAAEAGASHLRLAAPGEHEALGLACERAGLTRANSAPQPGTFKLLDPPAFLDKVRPLLAERARADLVGGLALSASAGGFEVLLASQRLVMKGQGELLRLVFEPGFGRDELPPGQLGDVLAACLPLPMVWTGFNYV